MAHRYKALARKAQDITGMQYTVVIRAIDNLRERVAKFTCMSPEGQLAILVDALELDNYCSPRCVCDHCWTGDPAVLSVRDRVKIREASRVQPNT